MNSKLQLLYSYTQITTVTVSKKQFHKEIILNDLFILLLATKAKRLYFNTFTEVYKN